MSTNAGDSALWSGVAINDGKVETRGGDVVGQDKVGGNKFSINTAFFGSVGWEGLRDSGRTSGYAPPLLPYLTDRTDQQRRLTAILQAQLDRGPIRPLTFFILGCDDECPDRFVDQVRFIRLPAILSSNGIPANILFRSLRWVIADDHAGTLTDGLEHELAELTDQVYDALGVKTTADKSIVAQKLANNSLTCLFHIGLSVSDWSVVQFELMAAWLRWLNALDLSNARSPVVTLVSVVYPSGFFHRLLFYRLVAALQRDVRALAGDAEVSFAVHVLPELHAVRFDDVDQWIKEYVENVDREVLRRLVRRHFSNVLGLGQRALSMYRTAEVVKAALADPLVRVKIQ